MISGLYLTINGKAETSWTESETYRDHHGKNRTRTVHYGAEEVYLNSITYLVGSQQGIYPINNSEIVQIKI